MATVTTTVDLTPVELSEIAGAEGILEAYTNYSLLEYDKLITELNAQHVPLTPDPGTVPLAMLNVQIAKVDAQKTRAASVYSNAIVNEDGLNVLYKKIVALYKAEFDRRLPVSPVKDFSNKELREGACNSLLANLKMAVAAIEGSLSQAKTFTKVVRNEFEKLDSTNKNISRQITVFQTQLEIGEIQRADRPTRTGPSVTVGSNGNEDSYTFKDPGF